MLADASEWCHTVSERERSMSTPEVGCEIKKSTLY